MEPAEVHDYFDVRISKGDPDRYRQAHARLDEVQAFTDKPWSGFNYYEGRCRSTVAVNADEIPSPTTNPTRTPRSIDWRS